MIYFTIFLLITQVFCEDAATETSASGDGEENISSVTMIDENGELLGSSINPSLINSTLMDSEMGVDTSLNTTLGDSTIAETTMVSTTTTTTVIVTETTTTEVPTTNVPTTTTSTTLETTTTSPTTSTVTSTSTEKPTTKVQLTSTTNKPTTEKKKPKSTTTTGIPQAPTVGTTYVPENEGKLCAFMDSTFICNEEIVCYGEGKIDCTEVEDIAPPSQTTLLEKASSSSLSEDYSDYEDTIGTFPPNLVGVVSPKKRLPFLYNMGTTDMSSDSSTETMKEETTPIGTEAISSVLTTEKTKTTTTVDAEMTQDKTLNVPNKAEVTTDSEIPLMTISSTDVTGEHTENIPSSSEISATKKTLDGAMPTQSAITTAEYVASRTFAITDLPDDLSTAIVEDSSEKSIRRKREDGNILSGFEASSSKFASFHMAALESSKQKIQVKACKISGNLRCSPSPSPTMCKGKTYCQVVSGTAEMPEKSTSAKGVENWAIAVIAICAIAAALTVSLLVYLVVTSWKKLKVQPQNGVTTLTYVNNTPP